MSSSEPKYDFLDAPLQPGDLGALAHYRVIDELGHGGMGFVFRAHDKRLQREVALKVMNQKVAGTPHSRRRFMREARAMAAIHHDNVATIFEVDEHGGMPFMAMEILQGSTLEAFNQGDRQLGFEEIIDYASQISRGLSAAHKKGIVHRDIKPANIWLDSEKNRIKILDFGLALAATPVDQLAGRGAVIGTPGYLSPEQARTEPLDDRSDLYSLGVVLYELCTGLLPLQASTVSGQLIAILAHRPEPIVDINAAIPLPLADLVHRLLYKEPRARVRSADAFLQELESVASECREKSDVAQTISKLQLGLDQVVNKKAQPVVVEAVVEVVEEAEVLDPFAAIPDSFAADPLAADGQSADPLSAAPIVGSASLAAMGRVTYASPPARPRVAAAPDWQKYLPFAAILALVVIALPIMAFFFSGSGVHQSGLVVGLPEDSEGKPAAPAGRVETTANRNASPGAQTQKNRFAKKGAPKSGTQKNGTQKSGAQKNRAAKNGAGQSSKRPIAPGGKAAGSKGAGNNKKNGGGKSAGNPVAAARPNQAKSGATAPAAKMANRATGSPANSKSGTAKRQPGSDSSVASKAAASPPAGRAMKWTTISANDGRGADAMVQIGTKQKLGLKPSIGIQKRGKIESHHSYIRFDLSTIEEVAHEVESAELVLTMVGRARPVGATIRLYGMSLKNQPLWLEEGPRSLTWDMTPSKQGLQSLPLLGSTTVTAKIDPRDKPQNAVRISGPKLSAFIRDSGSDTITLVLAGDSNSKSPLRFVSREGAAGNAPALEIRAPKEKLPKSK